MKEIEHLFKSLADKNRLRILGLLSKRKMCVCELAYCLGVTQPSVSRHLKRMKKVGLIQDEQDGFWTNYFIKCEDRKAKIIMEYLRKRLKEDKISVLDIRKLNKVNRTKLCCK